MNLYGALSGLENLRCLATLAGCADTSDSHLLQKLEEAGLPAKAARRKAGGYSKGMRQKVALAAEIGTRVGMMRAGRLEKTITPQALGELLHPVG